AVADAVDGAGVIIGDKQSAIRHLVHVRRPAPRLIVLQPPRGEALLLRWLAHGECDCRYAVSKLLGARPGAPPGDENAVLILRWEHGTGVEDHPDRRHVGSEL